MAPSRYMTERGFRQICFVAVDLTLVWLSAAGALYLRFNAGLVKDFYSNNYGTDYIASHVGVLLLYSGLIVLFCNTQKLYSGSMAPRFNDEYWGVGKAVLLATALQMACIHLSHLNLISSFVIVLTMFASISLLVGWRLIYRRYQQARMTAKSRNVIVVGHGQQAQALHDQLKDSAHMGYILKGTLAFSEDRICNLKCETVLGPIGGLRAVARANFIDDIFVCHHDREVVKSVVDEARGCGLAVHIVPDLYDGLVSGAAFEYQGRFPSLYLSSEPKPIVGLALKRWLDIICSIFVLVMGSPALLLIAFLIKIDSPGPVLYASTRIGRRGRTFRCFKFRTMVADAERAKADLLHLNERDGILFKIKNDPRITRVGRVLRKYSLDELAQFWNVLLGEMSMVGPRPPLAAEVEQYQLEHLRRLDVLPGITGLWQVESRSSPSFEDYISMDMKYVEGWHFWMDLEILLKTFPVLFAGTGQ